MLLDEYRRTRDALRYGYAVGKARVLETRALDRSAYERILDARDFAEQKRLLSETPYGRYVEHATTAEEVETALDEALDGFYRFLEVAALPEAVIRFFRARYDYANLKAALKASALGVPLVGLLVEQGTVAPARFTDDLADLPEDLARVAADAVEVPDSASIDARVDAAYFAALREAAREARSAYLVRLSALMIDLANVKTIVRSAISGADAEGTRSRLIEGGSVPVARLVDLVGQPVGQVAETLARMPAFKGLSTTDIADAASLDPATEALVTAELARGRREAAGPEPVIAYVMGREAEVRTLRVLLLGRLNGIDGETLRGRVAAAQR